MAPVAERIRTATARRGENVAVGAIRVKKGKYGLGKDASDRVHEIPTQMYSSSTAP